MTAKFITPFDISEIVQKLSRHDDLIFTDITKDNYKAKLDALAHDDQMIYDLRVYAAYSQQMSCNSLQVNNFINMIVKICEGQKDGASLILLDDILYDRDYVIPRALGGAHLLQSVATAAKSSSHEGGFLYRYHRYFTDKYYSPEKGMRYDSSDEITNCLRAIGSTIEAAIVNGDKKIENPDYLKAAARLIEKNWCGKEMLGMSLYVNMINAELLKGDDEFKRSQQVLETFINNGFLPHPIIRIILLYGDDDSFINMVEKIPSSMFGQDQYLRTFDLSDELSRINKFADNINYRLNKLIEVDQLELGHASSELLRNKIIQRAAFDDSNIFDNMPSAGGNPLIDVLVERRANHIDSICQLMEELSEANPTKIKEAINQFPFLRPHLGLLPNEKRRELVSNDLEI